MQEYTHIWSRSYQESNWPPWLSRRWRYRRLEISPLISRAFASRWQCSVKVQGARPSRPCWLRPWPPACSTGPGCPVPFHCCRRTCTQPRRTTWSFSTRPAVLTWSVSWASPPQTSFELRLGRCTGTPRTFSTFPSRALSPVSLLLLMVRTCV